MLTVDQIVTQIVNQLRLLDPSVSAEVGTPERKLIEAVSELIASQQVDFTVLNQQHDLSSMSGGRLDAYLSIFNFGRQQATPAYGVATFSRSVASSTAIVIPVGTPVIANISDAVYPQLTFITTQTVVLDANTTTADAPVQCTVGGTIGNIDANTVVGFGGLASINGITAVSNTQGMSGGSDQEDDASYKARFQNTFLRNISGTEDMFLALAVSVNSVTKANTVGPISRYQEYIQIPGADDANQVTPYDSGATFPHKRTSAESDIPYSKHTYAENYYLTDGTLDPATAKFFKPGVDYIFNTPPWDGTTGAVDGSNPNSPDITFLNARSVANVSGNPDLTEGSIVFLEHAYMSVHSRNSVGFGILNCVDVFVNGENLVSADSLEVVPNSANNLQSTNALLWTYQHPAMTTVINWKRKIDGVASAVGNRLQPFYWQPVVDAPDSLEIGTNIYYKANFFNTGDSTYYNQFDGTTYSFKAHYIVVEEVNSNYGTLRARNGIEWFLAGANHLNGQLPSDDESSYNGVKIDTLTGTEFTVEGYLYDGNIPTLQAIMEKNKQVTTDVLVHKARLRYFRPIITVMYAFGATKAVVDASIIATLDSFFENQYYGAAIQLSDILQAIHNVPGVDNVRWTNDDPSTGHKMEEVGPDGESLSGGPYYIVKDFFIQDNELAASPSATQVTITQRAQNTWQT